MSGIAAAPDATGQLDAAWIAARIPHAGDMCLLDGVVGWSETAIHCRASSHRLPDHPLQAAGRLGIANGIEYAAQAMAVHGAVCAGRDSAPQAGYLTSVRDVCYHATRLDDAADLDIHVECLSGEGAMQMYQFSISAGGCLLISGRASVMHEAHSGSL